MAKGTLIQQEKRKKELAKKKKAVKRLMKDWKEVQENPVENVSAQPLEKDIFTWHANLAGSPDTPWEGAILHLHMNFPKSYPNSPPQITLCTKIKHPNVIGGTSICLDMLQSDGAIEEYQGWSSSYTVLSILLQLQAFLFESTVEKALENIDDPAKYGKEKKEWFDSVKWSVEQSRRYQDKSVGHFPPRNPFPPFPTDEELKRVPKTFHEEALSEIVCFYTRQTFEEDCLGLGISFSKSLRTGSISHASVQMDLLSLRAFMNHRVRLSATNHSFTHFLPVYINEVHSKKSIHLMDRALSIISTGTHKAFDPKMVFEILPSIMNSCVVELMSGKRYSSTKALGAYCHIHRICLEYAKRFPGIVTDFNNGVDLFVKNGKFRHKDNCPDLGTMIATLSMADKQWDDIKDAFLDEFFTRNVFWILNKYPELEFDSKDITDDDRLLYSFKAMETSMKLVLFHLWFLKFISKPKGSSFDSIAKLYDQNYGRPTNKAEEEFLSFSKDLKEFQTLEQFFDRLKMKKSKEEILKILKDSIEKSSAKGYHGMGLQIVQGEKKDSIFDLECYIEKKGEISVLIDDEEKWKNLTQLRFGISSLPTYLVNATNPWRKCYLQFNLQDRISKLNDNPDFPLLHRDLDLSVELTHIELLSFKPTNIKSRYFFLQATISKLTNLETLIIRKGSSGLGCKGFKSLLKGLSNNSGNLQELVIEYCSVDPKSLHSLLQLAKDQRIGTNLRILNLSGNPLGVKGAEYLSSYLQHHENLPFLETLDVSDCQINSAGAKHLSEALIVKRRLKHLNLFRNPVEGGLNSIFTSLSYNPTIGTVKAGFTSKKFSNPSALNKLFDLTISLEELNLWRVPLKTISPSAIESLGHNQTLKKLDLGESGFKEFGVLGCALANNETLEELNLSATKATAFSLGKMYSDVVKEAKKKGIVPKISLKTLFLDHISKFNTEAKKAKKPFKNYLKLHENLTFLDLSHSMIDDRGLFTSLGSALESNLKLETLLLKDVGLKKNNCKELMQSIGKNSTLKHLDLSKNLLGAVGGGYVADAIRNTTSIEVLNLFCCFIEIEGMETISKAIVDNHSIKDLDLGLNQIRVRGAKFLIPIIPKLNSLEKLRLKHNRFNDKVALELAEACMNSNITFLSLAGNAISVDIRAHITARLSTAPRPIEFDLASLVAMKTPELMKRSVYITPLPYNITDIHIKKLFYGNNCGSILSVTIKKHKLKKSASSMMYAFVEFENPDSVELAIRLVHAKLNFINGRTVRILRVGNKSSKLK